MTSPSPASISQKLTSTSSLLLERSRILSLGLKPSPSSQAQIIRNLTSIRGDLDQLDLSAKGLVVGGSAAGKGKSSSSSSSIVNGDGVEELGERYDRLLEMLAEDEVGEEKVKALKRVQKSPTPPPALETGPTPDSPDSVLSSDLPKFSIDPPSPPSTTMGNTNGKLERFRDYPDDDEEENGDGPTPHDMLSNQQVLMEDQDARLNLLSHSIGRQNHLSIQIGSELDLHHQLLEDTDAAMDRTTASLGRARRRLDRVANEAKQYGSTITIVGLIFILLILIIVFKT